MTDAGIPRMASSTYGLPTWHARHSLAASATNRGSAPATVEAPAATTSMPSPSLSFEGITNQGPYVPGDPNGAVGPQHYVQTVNMHFAVYTKTTGALLFGPVAINTLWTGFGAPCETQNNGDPIVLYDQFADRWLISEFAIPVLGLGPFIQCVAVSTSGDPTGAYYQYQFQMPAVPGYPLPTR